jgi:hypothetical protein
MKIRSVGAELFHADGRADRHMTKLIVAFRNFMKVPKYRLDRRDIVACVKNVYAVTGRPQRSLERRGYRII